MEIFFSSNGQFMKSSFVGMYSCQKQLNKRDYFGRHKWRVSETYMAWNKVGHGLQGS